MPEHVVSPALFDSIDEYVLQLESGSAVSGSVVPETSPVLSFTENAFAQFFENEVASEIVGFDEKSKRQAARLRRTRKDELIPEVRRLISLYEQFCDVHDDVLGAGYGGQDSVLEEFHSKLVVRLLKRIGELAAVKKDDELGTRADSALEAFTQAIDGYDWKAG
jgi:hypothetical protein